MDIQTLISLIAGGGVITTGSIVVVYFMWRRTVGPRSTAALVRIETMVWLLILGYIAFSYVNERASHYVIVEKSDTLSH